MPQSREFFFAYSPSIQEWVSVAGILSKEEDPIDLQLSLNGAYVMAISNDQFLLLLNQSSSTCIHWAKVCLQGTL